MRKIYLLTFMMMLLTNLRGQAEQITLHVERAGTLPNMIDGSRIPLITDLKLTGELNGTDISFIRQIGDKKTGRIEALDLSETRIVTGGSPYADFEIFGKYYTSNDTIGEYMFTETCMSKIILPNSTLTIGDEAFSGCTSLTSINIPNSTTTIGNKVFSGCTNLTGINIPNSVTTIGSMVFSYCI